MHILKIILYLLVGILALLVAVLLLNVKLCICVGDAFTWRLTLGGIKIYPAAFQKKHKKGTKKEAKPEKANSKAAVSTSQNTQNSKEKDSDRKLKLVFELLHVAAKQLPRVFRIRLKKLDITVGGEDAADIALNYGALHALVGASLGALDAYRGLFYGFRANRKKIRIRTDFLLPDTQLCAKVCISCYVWQLAYAAVRLGLVYIIHTLENDKKEK